MKKSKIPEKGKSTKNCKSFLPEFSDISTRVSSNTVPLLDDVCCKVVTFCWRITFSHATLTHRCACIQSPACQNKRPQDTVYFKHHFNEHSVEAVSTL